MGLTIHPLFRDSGVALQAHLGWILVILFCYIVLPTTYYLLPTNQPTTALLVPRHISLALTVVLRARILLVVTYRFNGLACPHTHTHAHAHV